MNESMKLYEQYLAALRKDISTFSDMPDLVKTPEVCLAVVYRKGTLLEYVPLPLRTRGLCIAAVRDDSDALAFVPDKYKTYDFYMELFTSKEYDRRDKDILDFTEDDRDFREAFDLKGGDTILRYVPECWKTAELCLAAVKFNGDEF